MMISNETKHGDGDRQESMYDINNDISRLQEELETQEVRDSTLTIAGEGITDKVLNIDSEVSEVDLISTMDHIEDIFDRANCQYVLLGESARGLYEMSNPFAYSKEIHIGVRQSHFYGANKDILMDNFSGSTKVTDNNVEYMYNGVKVTIDLLSNSVRYFNEPDGRWFKYMFLPIPNPFTEYYEVMVLKKALEKVKVKK